MELPDLVREELGGEEILAGVSIGDEDVVCATSSRTLVYRSEGLLSDERLDAYSHNADRLQLSKGRRKTKFVLTYVDGTQSFTVPSDYTRDVLTLLLEGILSVGGVLDGDESVVGAFRFSELTLVIAERKLIRHIGETVWDDDYETYAYEDITGLDFEEGSVATEIIVSIDGRPQRIKTPREDARLVEETLKTAVFDHYDVTTLEELDRIVGRSVDEATTETSDDGMDLSLGPGIDPLVSDPEPDGPAESEPLESDRDTDDPIAEDSTPSNPGRPDRSGTVDDRSHTPQTSASGESDRSPESSGGSGSERPARNPASSTQDPDPHSEGGFEFAHDRETDVLDETEPDASQAPDPDVPTAEEFEALEAKVENLSDAVKRQNELLKKQHGAIKELVEQLRSR